ncbi:MAG: TlpA disulfide reductase family protein [Acidobacteriota bacterium]
MKILITALMSCGLLLQAASPVPRPAGPYKITEPSGQQLDINSFKGKVCLVQFLFTWCPHCAATAEKFTTLQNELGPKGLQVIGVAFNDEDDSRGKKADGPELARFKLAHAGFPVGYVSRTSVLKYLGFSVMDRLSVPLVMIIDRNGIVQYQDNPTPSADSQNLTFLREKLGKLLDAKADPKMGASAKASPSKVAAPKAHPGN